MASDYHVGRWGIGRTPRFTCRASTLQPPPPLPRPATEAAAVRCKRSVSQGGVELARSTRTAFQVGCGRSVDCGQRRGEVGANAPGEARV